MSLNDGVATRYRVCPLCEAACGLAVATRGREIVAIRGHRGDVLSRGHVCEKGLALRSLDADDRRLRSPLVRRNGRLAPSSWRQALDLIAARLPAIRRAKGADAIAVYAGNPVAHHMGLTIGFSLLRRALNTRNIYTGSTVDQMPKQLACALMFGDPFAIPVPDIDRTHYLLILGANPIVSNGSLWTVPGFAGRASRLRERGGRLVVVDPRRTETAAIADAHHCIVPGTDIYFLLALLNMVAPRGLASPRSLSAHSVGHERVMALAASIDVDEMSARCGIARQTVEQIAQELTAAPSACVYGRMGTTTQEHGTLVSWLIDLVNVVTGNLDRPGGAMFARPAAFSAQSGHRPSHEPLPLYRYRSRVSGHFELFGELPLACLAEEIDTPGPDRVCALITLAGNPAVSAPNSRRVQRALGQLDFHVSMDMYLNETNEHADVVLPAQSPFEKEYFDILGSHTAVRNVARYSPPLFEPPNGALSEWQALLQLTAIVSDMGVLGPVGLRSIERVALNTIVARRLADAESPAYGRAPASVVAALSGSNGLERLLDAELRLGPYGDGCGTRPGGLTLDRLRGCPDGIDLGPLQPRVTEVLRTASGAIELAPPLLIDAVNALLAAPVAPRASFYLIGRRQHSTHNSWLHASAGSTRPARGTLLMHPDDAVRLQLQDGDVCLVRAGDKTLAPSVQVSSDIMPGVVSLPHGWGQARSGESTTPDTTAINFNELSNDGHLEALSGTAILNGLRVSVEPLRSKNRRFL